MKRRIFSVVLIVAMLLTLFAVPTAAASALKLTDATYPTVIKQGDPFIAKGVVTSDCNILTVVIGAYTSSGEKSFEYTAKPGTKSYDISNVDYLLTFSKLKSGSYIYKIVASDTKSTDVVLLNKSFTVNTTGTSSEASTLKISNANYPTSLTVGQAFSVTGVVSSNYNISKVVIGAYTSSGTKGFEYTAKPGTKSYDISNVDYLLTFSKLNSGTYTYKITATDSKQSDVVLLQKTFTVSSAGNSASELKKVNWDVIDISYWNTINSWSRLAANHDAVILRLGFSYTSSKKQMEDDCFEEFYKSAKSNGIPVGCYYFSAATTVAEAKAEADFVLGIMKKYGCKFEMPVYYDMETDAQVNLSQSACTEVARAFCDKLRDAGYYVGIYCNKYFARDEIYASKLSDYQFWIAQYGSSCTYNGEYGMWQYSETGDPPGVDYPVDLDYCYYDYPSYIKAKGLNGFTATVTTNPQFSFKTGTNLKVSGSVAYLKNESELTKDQFISKYVQYKDVTVSVSSLKNNKIGTGTKIFASGNGKSFGPYTICLMGDTNSDAKVNSSDALAILNHTVGTAALTGYSLSAADWNGDGKINSEDALAVLKFSVSG